MQSLTRNIMTVTDGRTDRQIDSIYSAQE